MNSVDDAPLACPTCGRPVDAHDRHVRFRLPDPVLAVPDQERTEGTWLSHADANQSVMMMVPTVGTFVRSLLPVRLTGGYTGKTATGGPGPAGTHAPEFAPLPTAV